MSEDIELYYVEDIDCIIEQYKTGFVIRDSILVDNKEAARSLPKDLIVSKNQGSVVTTSKISDSAFEVSWSSWHPGFAGKVYKNTISLGLL